MDQSPGSAERRANLIRQMARRPERPHSRGSDASSNAFTTAVNHPYETDSQPVAPIRLNQDYQLNSSAIKRAFPDFSQGSSSSEDSIEIGRGAKRGVKGPTHEHPISEDVTEDLPFTFANGAQYRVTATPPMKPKSKSTKLAASTKPAKATELKMDRDAEDKENSQNPIRRLPDIQPTVESEDSGFVGTAKATNQHQVFQNTRFDNRKPNPSEDVEPEVQNATNASINSALNGTHPSFVLPDMPNITELISGVRQDGTPLFTRSAKSKSRFTTPSQSKRGGGGSKYTHVPVANVAAETDDKVLYVSLQLLQEKVKTLETEKAQTERKLGEYELEVLQLRSKLEETDQRRNSDSGLGTDPEEVESKNIANEKSKLELSIKTLQDRLNRANRKVTKSDLTIQNLHNDRDAAHQQLAVAFLNSEELKNESQAMRHDIEHMKDQLARINRNHGKKLEQLARQETELRGKIERREKAINEMSSLVKELWQTRKALAMSDEVQQNPKKAQHQVPEPVNLEKSRKSTANRESQRKAQKFGNIATQDEVSDGDSTTHIRYERASFNVGELSKNSTYMSFMEGDEVAKLQAIVDQDKQTLGKPNPNLHADASASHAVNQAMPRKSSLKKASRDENPMDDLSKANQSSGASRRNSQHLFSQQDKESNRRKRLSEPPELTSAFIVPDITLDAQQIFGQLGKQTISVSRPVPVSERGLRSGNEEDMTIRPAQSPGTALAMVMKSLEDELEQLRVQVTQQEALYHQHDPALSKSRRKMVYARIQRLLAAIEVRADQIYALYDVLEGQKASGQTMKEEEVEVTLQNIGIDIETLRRHGFKSEKTGTTRLSINDETFEERNDDDIDNETEELPWEGFEPTQTQTIDSLRRLERR